MKQTTKQLLHLAWSGISIALTIFVLIGVVADTICGGRLVFGDWFFSKSAVGVAVSGMAFSLPVLIYDREKLSYGWKILLHLGTGCIVTFLAGIFAGWVPFGNWLLCIVIFFAEIVVSFIGWFFFASYYQNLADKMNRKIFSIDNGELEKIQTLCKQHSFTVNDWLIAKMMLEEKHFYIK